jgi:hypothetical protein
LIEFIARDPLLIKEQRKFYGKVLKQKLFPSDIAILKYRLIGSGNSMLKRFYEDIGFFEDLHADMLFDQTHSKIYEDL